VDALRVILADKDASARQGLMFCLRRLASRVDILEAASQAELLAQIESGPAPDLILLDLGLPGMRGVKGLKAMSAELADIAIVALSDSFDRKAGLDAIVAGAAGFIPKTMDGRSLLNALELVRAGQAVEIAASEATQTDAAGINPLKLLTLRERTTLNLLCCGHAHREIARRLKLPPTTVAKRLKGIYRTLSVRNRRQAVEAAISLGWRDNRNRSTGTSR
jgi:DNA-binding NarL/FixJ family response regulator